MYLFYESMALFWTLAEGLILIFLRQGLIYLKRGKTTRKNFLVFCVTGFALLICLAFFGEGLLGRFLPLERGLNLTLYRWALWNLFCTVWVIIEGVILVYVLRIYMMLKPPQQKREARSKNGTRGGFNSGYPIPLLIAAFFALYGFYEYNVLSLTYEKGLHAREIYRLSVFYIKVCGLFWILIEWIVALLGLKTYFILKRRGDTIQ